MEKLAIAISKQQTRSTHLLRLCGTLLETSQLSIVAMYAAKRHTHTHRQLRLRTAI